jgi:signal transduction histidine kinase
MRIIIFLTLLVSSYSGTAAEEPIRTIAGVRATSHEEADKQLPVLVEGTVIYFHNKLEEGSGAMGFVLHDGNASCWVGSPAAFPNRHQIRAGSRVRVRGVTSGSTFFPDIRQAVVEVLSQGELPKPRRVTARELFAPNSDSDWVEVEAKIIGVETGGLAFTLVVEIDGLTFKADVPEVKDAKARTAALMQRPILLKALVGSTANKARQLTTRHLLVPSFDLLTPLEAKSTRADIRTKTIGTLLRSDHGIDEEIRVVGVVTQVGDGGLYLKDESGSTFVQAADADQYPPGSEVEVVGYAALAPFRPILRAARLRKLGKAELSAPFPFNAAHGLRLDLHGERVEVIGEFLALREGLSETVLQCRSGETYFEAWLPRRSRHAMNLKQGDTLSLTGVCEVTTTRPVPRLEWADGFRIHLPGPAAIDVVRQAPWWTLTRILIALGIALSILAAVFVWNWLLRRRVATQAKTIARQAEVGIVKDERQRIARELHDTLEQELTGLSMQLGNLASIIRPQNEPAHQRLSLARNMLRHCRTEARASVSDFRSPGLLERNLPDAMRETLPPAAGDSEFEFVLHGTDRRLRGTTQNHLMRIAREAVFNAARHGKATRITVTLTYDSEGVTLEIDDDGCGFDSSAPAPAGHFGLLGMQERANKIQGTLQVVSTPDKGTNIRLVLPYSSPEALPRDKP